LPALISPDVIGMAMGEGDDVDVLGLIAGLAEPLDQMAVRHAPAQCFVIACERAVAGVEQNKFLAGVDDRRNERMFELVRIDIVHPGEFFDCAGGAAAMDARKTITYDGAVEHVHHFEAA
jgi:hypothetical protein